MEIGGTKIYLTGVNPNDYDLVSRTNNTRRTNIKKLGNIGHTIDGTHIRVLKRGNIFDKDDIPYESMCNKPCWWCRYKIDERAMGIPVKIDGDSVWMDGLMCSYECVYAFLDEHYLKSHIHQNPHWTNSITLLKQLFYTQFPEKPPLVKAIDWKLLKRNGYGNITIGQFREGFNYNVKSTSNIRYYPVESEYIVFKDSI